MPAVYGSNSNITLLETVFEHNNVNKIIHVSKSNLLVLGCRYQNNYGQFLYGLNSIVTLTETVFDHNSAYRVISSYNSAIF